MLFYLNLHNSSSAPPKSWNTSSIYGCIVDATVDVGLHSPEYLAALLGMRREHNILYIWHQKQLKSLDSTMYAGRDAKTPMHQHTLQWCTYGSKVSKLIETMTLFCSCTCWFQEDPPVVTDLEPVLMQFIQGRKGLVVSGTLAIGEDWGDKREKWIDCAKHRMFWK